MQPGVHSGTSLGERLDISRVAIKKRIDRLEAAGFPVEAVPGRGYRIAEGFELLSADRLQQHLRPVEGIECAIDIFQSLPSTNQYLGDVDVQDGELRAVLAESQPAGQGRRGRTWISSPYRDLMLSIGYRYPVWPENAAGLSLTFSVAVHRALTTLGADSVQIKWPNDLLSNGKKLAGLLINVTGEPGRELNLVMGAGINLATDPALLVDLDQPATSLLELGAGPLSRNQLAAEILSNTAEMLVLYSETGFAPFAEYWNGNCMYQGQMVRLFAAGAEHRGILQGVNELGVLCLSTPQGQMKFSSAELSLRPIEV